MKKIALVIGHSEKSQGAVNHTSGLTEFKFNSMLAIDIEAIATGVDIVRVCRDTYRGLPSKINKLKPDFIISLHCNAFNRHATGTETLFYHKSRNSRDMAEIINRKIVGALGLKDRGIKPKTSEDRGGYLLRCTHAPCVIVEPFFIDNDSDLSVAQANYLLLVTAMGSAIMDIAAVD